jgi:hypothetical protein
VIPAAILICLAVLYALGSLKAAAGRRRREGWWRERAFLVLAPVFVALWAAKEWLSPSLATAGPGVIHD